jgi:hypothetical protein
MTRCILVIDYGKNKRYYSKLNEFLLLCFHAMKMEDTVSLEHKQGDFIKSLNG